MKGPHTTRDFDWTLLGLVLAIATLGVVEIYSATRNTVWEGAHLKQLLWIGLGLVLFWAISRVDYKSFVDQAPIFYAITIILLLMVEVFGVTIGGAKRWLPLPAGLHLQVSEFAKVVLVLLVAWFFMGSPARRVGLARLGQIAALFAVPMVLVVRQPDLSTALSYLPILVLGVLLAGMRWRHLAVLALLGLLAAPIVWRQLQPYQKERLIAFVDPESDPRGIGYQSIQSKIAVGAGGIWGQGFARGSQTQLRFLPVPHTDFIFSAYAEETGFVGVSLALALYFAVLMRVVGNAQTAADTTGMYVCMGVAGLLLFHLVVNVGMVIGQVPVTGLPLPLMSYGGSNALTTFLLFGLVNNVRLRRFTN